MHKAYPCELDDMRCPYDATSGMDCRDRCGAGADDDIDELLLELDSSVDCIPDPLSYDNDRDFELYSIYD